MKKSSRGKELPFVHPFTEPASAAAFEALCTEFGKHDPEFPESVAYDMAACCKRFIYPRNAVLIDYRDMYDCLFFLVRGLVASQEKVDGQEHYSWFASDSGIIVPIEESATRARSRRRLRALAETECLVLQSEDLKMLREKHPAFMHLELKLTRQCCQHALDLNRWGRMNATRKYRTLKEFYPCIFERVTLTALASFLGVSRKHLSAIKSRDASK